MGPLNPPVPPAFVACNRRSDYARKPRSQGGSKEVANPPCLGEVRGVQTFFGSTHKVRLIHSRRETNIVTHMITVRENIYFFNRILVLA